MKRFSKKAPGRAIGVGACLAATSAVLVFTSGASPVVQPPKAGPGDISGVVSGPHGAEAGVWVVAETQDLPTRYAKIVVTDEKGRFLVPDLPGASYRVWARGYGILDTANVQARPGATVRLTAHDADPVQAAQGYPAVYWFSMLKIPPVADFSGPARSQMISDDVTQNRWVNTMKAGLCVSCHQLGDQATRTIPAEFKSAGSSEAQWIRRVQSGSAGMTMLSGLGALGPLSAKTLADWTDRIAAGQIPKTKPIRPQGLERNVVITTWDWLDGKHYLHDAISTDARNPTVNAYGPVYGSTELSTDDFPVLDPVRNTVRVVRAPVRDPGTPVGAAPLLAPSAYWGDEAIWDSKANIHNQMLDQQGRVWMTATVRDPADEPSFCKQGSPHPSAQAEPLARALRQLSVFDPRTGKYDFVDTCFATHHLQFDSQDRLWTSGGGPVVGWLDVREFERTHDAAAAQGWTPMVLDSNGNGRRDAYTEPGQPADPSKDRRIIAPFYAIMPSPADGSVWGSVWVGGQIPDYDLVRIDPGADPSRTALAEGYRLPAPGFGMRGAAIDSQGVVWAGLASGHLASFDRRKCRGKLNGPAAVSGAQCPEGWSLYPLPGPIFESGPRISAEASYYTWIDRFNTLGLGKDVPIVTGNLSDAFHAFVGGKFVTLRLPYPLGFYAKGLDGRIDDPAAGWKGRGLWSTSGERTPWHHEGGKGARPFAVHVQFRPNPLAD